MTQKPNSDQSGRATRRREEQEVTRAQRTVARAQAQPRPVEGGLNISIDDLLRKIGVLTVERDAMQLQITQQQTQITQQQAQIERLLATLNPQGEEAEEETQEEPKEELTEEAPEAEPLD